MLKMKTDFSDTAVLVEFFPSAERIIFIFPEGIPTNFTIAMLNGKNSLAFEVDREPQTIDGIMVTRHMETNCTVSKIAEFAQDCGAKYAIGLDIDKYYEELL